MNTTLKHRALLATSAAVAATVGIAILVAPAAFHATNGIEFDASPRTLSELRAPGGGGHRSLLQSVPLTRQILRRWF